MPTTTDSHARNDRILALGAEGRTQREIAVCVGLTERHVRRVLNERSRARARVRDVGDGAHAAADVTTIILIDELEDVVATLAATAAAYAGPHRRTAAVELTRARMRAGRAIATLRTRVPQLVDQARPADMSAKAGGRTAGHTDEDP